MITTGSHTEPIRVAVVADVARSLRLALGADSRFEVAEQIVHSPSELVIAARDAVVLVTRHHNRISSETLDGLPALKVIAQATSGLDNIDASARERGIAIVATPGANANAVAEYVLGQIITLTRELDSYHAMIAEGGWNRSDCARLHELSSFALGIVGIGHVGSRVSALAGMLGMKVLAFDPYLTADEIAHRGAIRCDSLGQLLDECSILTLHAPLTEETRDMIGARELDRLRPGSYVINAARGELLDFEALLRGLASGRIAGAACDVFDPEPARLTRVLPANLRLSPHIAGCTAEAKEGAGLRLYDRICAALGLDPIRT